MTFSELPAGAKFRCFRRGLLLTKASENTYTALAGHAQKAAPNAEVLPEDEDTPAPRATPKPDDVALLSKALDDLEAKGGKTPELAAVEHWDGYGWSANLEDHGLIARRPNDLGLATHWRGLTRDAQGSRLRQGGPPLWVGVVADDFRRVSKAASHLEGPR